MKSMKTISKSNHEVLMTVFEQRIKDLNEENKNLKSIIKSVQDLCSENYENNSESKTRQFCYSLIRDHINTLKKMYEID